MAVLGTTACLPHSKFIAIRFADNPCSRCSEKLYNRRVVWGGKVWTDIRTDSEERQNSGCTFEHEGRTRGRHVGGTYVILHRDSHAR